MRVTIRAMEAYLRDTGTPYVAVDEAKRALFTGVNLKAFDFVVYAADGPNWLVTCKPFSVPGMADTMREWEKVFGKGFMAVEARIRRGRYVLVTLDGKTIDLPPVGQPKTEESVAAPTDAAPPQAPESVRPERTLFDMEV